ncbi:DNA polymerase/3'-5' exonuclease PolX [Candidatus Woesearchaeota archaeon]|nr:DNA polymerase/3'-5' exonuclease PolX [Candidatus Woesearchaeota archaeon]
MKNQELATIFYEMADLLEILQVPWKPNAFRKAARTIETLSKPIEDVYANGGVKALKELPGVGDAIANKTEEFLKTGKIKELHELEQRIPKGVDEMMHIPGLGPKKAVMLNKELHIKNLRDLQRAAETGKIRKLAGFGEKSEQEILKGLSLHAQGQERKSLLMGLDIARELQSRLKTLAGVERVEVAGSVRRRKETIADIDLFVTSKNAAKVMDFFTTMSDVTRILAKGPTKSAVLIGNLQADVRVLEPKSFGAALQYFTGSKEHNVRVRQIAIDKGFKLNEYGLFTRAGKYVAGKTEQDIYKKLNLQYPEPELRENTGEIEAKKLPTLIPYDAIKGDCHMHTRWSDGGNTTEEMVRAAIEKGYEYLAITDHSKSSIIANGLDEKRLLKHCEEIDTLQKKFPQIVILKGSEVDIRKDGSLDYKPAILKQLDIVMASAHQRFTPDRAAATQRYLKVIQSGNVTAISHPTGRLINAREPIDFDFEKVAQACADANVFLEINSSPSRLDLKDSLIRTAKELNAPFIINTDSHTTEHLRFIELGIAQARRGWLEAKDVVNTLPRKKFLSAIK